MPLYSFENPETKEEIEVFFGMNEEPKEYIGKDGVKWNRIFVSPQLNTVGKIDPWDNADFVNKTAQKKGTYGDLLDTSAELSAQRAGERGGVDPLKQKYYDNYAENRAGKRHPKEIAEKTKKNFENKDIKIEL
ncbi:hypothetical protein CL634_10125 [bacterium]|nr:hypothetical protein [bacterium]